MSELDEAANAVERKLREGINRYSDQLEEISARVKEVEQRSASGYSGGGPELSGGTSQLASSMQSHDQFQAMKSGQANKVKMTFEQPLLVKNTITGDSGSPAEPSDTIVQPGRMPGIVGGSFRRILVRDLLPTMPTSSNQIEYTREDTWTNEAGVQQGEGTDKPESDLTFELGEAPVRTFAHIIKASKQVLDDSAALQSFVERRMRHGVEMELQDQILNGDGTDQKFNGLINQATAYSGATTGDNYLDTLSRAIEQLELNDWTATGIVLNPADWRAISRIKVGSDDERYLLGQPQVNPMAQVWGLPVATTNDMPSGQFIVSDFAMSTALFIRQEVVVEMFEQDATNVQQNLLTFRAEQRAALAVLRPSAIIHGSF